MNFKRVIYTILTIALALSLCGCVVRVNWNGDGQLTAVKHLYISLPDGNVIDGVPDYLYMSSYGFVDATINGVRYKTSLSRCVVIYE